MKNFSWINPPFQNKTLYEDLCISSKSSDFYFYLKEDLNENIISIYLVPVLYFKKEKNIIDEYDLDIQHLLPKDFMYEMESVYYCDRPFIEVQKDMLNRGFKQNKRFNQLIDKKYYKV